MNINKTCIIILGLAFVPGPVISAGLRTTVRPEIEIGSERTGNVYQDYSALPDQAGLLNVNIRSSIHYSPAIFSWWDYQLALKKYSEYDFFDYNLHTLNGRINKNIGEWGGLELKTLYMLYQQPNYTVYNFSNLYILPEIKYYITDYTICKLGYAMSSVAYPQYILDYNSSGPSLKLTREFSLFTTLELDLLSAQKSYPEWQVFSGTSGVLSSDHQDANETETGLTLAHAMQDGQAGCYYRHTLLDSNANFIDYGKDITFGTGDESLVGNYYNNYSQKFGAYIQYKILDKLSPLLSVYLKDTFYQSRLARNSSGNFTDEKRQDRNITGALSFTYPLAKTGGASFDIKFSYSNENNASNDYFYTYINETIGLSFFCRL
ncbi:MAG: hypothetical protein A2297_00115 [Elusimicrobia bacterium RIFOXYB2_FULL_48_7]|nr:MAG: hypothetical protein A2297_00115 [Elusimicrobia bacterium RIFOXYB2_FULL_48_7]